MINDDKIRDKKLQFDINRGVAMISALSLDKIDKYEYLSGKAIQSLQQHRRSQSHLFFTREGIGKTNKNNLTSTVKV